MKMIFRVIPVLFVVAMIQPSWAANADIVGFWMTEDDESKIEIFECGDKICGKIAWIPEPNNADGTPKLDLKNKNPELRTRLILDLPLMDGFEAAGRKKWKGGTIYSARSGKTHKVTLKLKAPDRLKVGKWIFGQVWRRAGPEN